MEDSGGSEKQVFKFSLSTEREGYGTDDWIGQMCMYFFLRKYYFIYVLNSYSLFSRLIDLKNSYYINLFSHRISNFSTFMEAKISM